MLTGPPVALLEELSQFAVRDLAGVRTKDDRRLRATTAKGLVLVYTP